MKNIAEINMQKYLKRALNNAPAHFNLTSGDSCGISANQISEKKFVVKIPKKDVCIKISRAAFFDTYQPFFNNAFQNIRSSATFRFLEEHQRIDDKFYSLKNLLLNMDSPYYNDTFYYQNELHKLQFSYINFCQHFAFYMCGLDLYDYDDNGSYVSFYVEVDSSYPIQLLL